MAASQDEAETASEQTDQGLEMLSLRMLEEKVEVNIQQLSKCNL